VAAEAVPLWKPEGELVNNSRHMTPTVYGMTTWADLFTARQLTALSTFAALVGEAREKVQQDAIIAWTRAYSKTENAELHHTGDEPSGESGHRPREYADAVATYLAFAIDKMTDTNSKVCTWQTEPPRLRATFGRQAIPMTWDFAEANIFGDAAGDFGRCIGSLTEVLDRYLVNGQGTAQQENAEQHGQAIAKWIIATDPPYYDNVPYADLADYFYVWLRHTLGGIYPDLFGTMFTPKTPELIADPFRHGGKEESRQFFEAGMRRVFARICETAHPDYPVTVIYAFKQSESDDTDNTGDTANDSATASTGWETMLQALIGAGHQITGTWPMRTELASRIRGNASNALASSIALVCRPRDKFADKITRREFQAILRSEVANAIRALQSGNIAPVDLQQSAIGPGMAVFSRYAQVLEANGKAMTVRTALQDINRTLDSVIESGDFDNATNWAISWFSQYGFEDAPYGGAETLATAKAVTISGLVHDGIVRSGGGKVKLLSRDELPSNYDPSKDDRVTVWEVTQYLTYALDQEGVAVAGEVMRAFRNSHPEVEIERARDLAYRLFALCDGKKWAQEARPYNALVLSWGDIELESQKQEQSAEIKGGLFGNGLV
jgi:putative DNA methylase